MASNQKPPVLRTKCQHCGNQKHAVQYLGERLEQLSELTVQITYDRPGVCLVCPRCDSPSVAVADA